MAIYHPDDVDISSIVNSMKQMGMFASTTEKLSREKLFLSASPTAKPTVVTQNFPALERASRTALSTTEKTADLASVGIIFPPAA